MIKKIAPLYHIYLLILFGFEIQAQEINQYFGPSVLDEFIIKHYTNENGLKQTIVNGIFLDQNEFLWLNTPSGLIRWDKDKFRYFRDKSGEKNRILKILRNPQNEQEFIVVFRDLRFGKITDSDFQESSDSISLEHLINIKLSENARKRFLRLDKRVQILSVYFKSIHEQIFIHRDSLHFINDGVLEHTYKNGMLRFNRSPEDLTIFNVKKSFFIVLKDFSIAQYKSSDCIVYHNTLEELIKKENLYSEKIKFFNNYGQRSPVFTIGDNLYEISFVNDTLKFIKSPLDLNILDITDIVFTKKKNIFII